MVLNIAKAIGTTTEEIPATTEDAVFFDLFGAAVVSYPASYCVVLQLAATLLMLFANNLRKGIFGQMRAILLGMLLIVILIAVTALSGFATSIVLSRTGIIDRNLTARIGVVMAAYWQVALLVFLGQCAIYFRSFSADSVWNAVWIGWTGVGLFVAYYFPEVSFVCLYPCLLAGLLSLTPLTVRTRSGIAAIGTSLLLLPTLHLFPIAMGAYLGAVICPVFSLVLIPLCPLFGESSGESTITIG